jgi:hypothetical protein
VIITRENALRAAREAIARNDPVILKAAAELGVTDLNAEVKQSARFHRVVMEHMIAAMSGLQIENGEK